MTHGSGWFRRYAAATTAMTLTLFSLGVYTAATGSGLACEAQWPLCSDQLIPALVINPDFIEWFHRVWAMITGFLIVGVAAWTWLGGLDRRVRYAATAAVAILPLQITVGAITVTLSGRIPGGYTVSTHAAHFVVALVIFTLLVLATVWAGGRRSVLEPSPRTVRLALLVGLVGVLASSLLSRAVPLVTYSPGAQAGYYALGLFGYGSLLTGFVYAIDAGLPAETATRIRWLTATGIALLVGTLLLGRDLVLYTPTWQLVNLLVLAGAILAIVGAVWVTTRGIERSSARTPTSGD